MDTLKKKHTSGLDLRKVVPPAIDLYLGKAGAFVLDIETMKNIDLTDAEAKALIFDAFVTLGPRAAVNDCTDPCTSAPRVDPTEVG